MIGCLVNVHIVAELTQQQRQARTVLRCCARVVRQQVQAVGRIGEQKMAQDVVSRCGIEASFPEIFLKNKQAVLCQAAQRIQRVNIVRDAA